MPAGPFLPRPRARHDWSLLPIHSLLLAAYFPLFLLTHNADEWVDLSKAWLPTVACVVAGGAALVICARLFGGWQRGGLVASLLIVLFFTLGHARLAAVAAGIGAWWLGIAWVAAAVAGLALIARGARWLPDATRLLNVAAAFLVAYNLFGLLAYLVPSQGGSIGLQPASIPTGEISRRPDIYYIVLDRYANEQTLRDLYGYDNTAFLSELEQRGFTVAHDSWANYGKTSLSLASSLDMDYLDAEQLQGEGGGTYGPIHAALQGHLAVPDTLTDLGYEYVHIASWWEPAASNVDADVVVRFRNESEFTLAVIESSALGLIAATQVPERDPEAADREDANRAHTQFEFVQLEASAARAGPTYVFVHFLVPHPPYVFNADGTRPTAEETAARGDRASYVEQLRWTNERVLETLDILLAGAPDDDPVIILQADEGPYPPRYEADQRGFPWLAAEPQEVQEKFGILSAYHLPGVDASALGLHDRTSPVNTFRIVFNAYFGTDLPLLADQTYLSPDEAHLYEFVPYRRPE